MSQYGKVVWTLYSDADRQYYRMWIIQDRRNNYIFRLTSRKVRTDEWITFERCTTGRAKWWTKILLNTKSCVPVK